MKTRYDVTQPEIIVDKKTGLTWARTANLQPMTFDEATKWVKALSIAGKSDWRLPTKEEWREFTNICDDNRYWAECMTKLGVPTNPEVLFWSSSTSPNSQNSRWIMRSGVVYDAIDDKYCVWPIHQHN